MYKWIDSTDFNEKFKDLPLKEKIDLLKQIISTFKDEYTSDFLYYEGITKISFYYNGSSYIEMNCEYFSTTKDKFTCIVKLYPEDSKQTRMFGVQIRYFKNGILHRDDILPSISTIYLEEFPREDEYYINGCNITHNEAIIWRNRMKILENL